MDPLILKILASIAFGLAAMLLVFTAQRLVQTGAEDPQRYGGDSMRRAEMRRRALRNSALWVFALPLNNLLSHLVERMGPESLRA